MILHLLKRLFFILLGYILATLASGAVVTASFFVSDVRLRSSWHTFANDVPGTYALITMLIGMYAALPAAAAIILGEVRPIRSRLYYMIVGCVIGTGLPVYVQTDWWYVPIGFLFGFIAGLIYWRVAGRKAGL